jgi:hypothetical protein
MLSHVSTRKDGYLLKLPDALFQERVNTFTCAMSNVDFRKPPLLAVRSSRMHRTIFLSFEANVVHNIDRSMRLVGGSTRGDFNHSKKKEALWWS